MNRYEMVNIIDVNWGDGEPAPAQKMISEEIVKSGGSVEDIGSMGRRKLAYPINRHNEGVYLVSHLTHSPQGLVLLRESLKLNPAVIRTLLVRYDGQPGFTIREEEPKMEPSAAEREAGPERTLAEEEEEPEEEYQPDRTPELQSSAAPAGE